MAKHVVVYHDKCNDGFGAAFIAWKALVAAGHEVELRPANYGEAYPAPYGDHLHILDFSYPTDVLLYLCTQYETVTWLDHHKTAIDAFAAEGYMDGTNVTPASLRYWLTDKHSGAMLAHLHYCSDLRDFPLKEQVEAAPLWVRMIDDRDRWQFKLPFTKEFHAGLSLYSRTTDAWNNLFSSSKTPQYTDNIIQEGHAVLQYQHKLYEQLMETAHEITIDGKHGLAINAPGQFASELGHLLCKQSGTFGAVYSTDGACYKFSLRSEGDYDVSAIAKAFGGGGHKNAAGFSITNGWGITGEATGVALWSRTDELTSYVHDAGGGNND